MDRIRARLVPVAVVVFACALLTPLQAQERPGYLGMGFSVEPLSGILTVKQIVPGSPSEIGMLRVGDIVEQVGGEKVRFLTHRDALAFLSARTTPGEPLTLRVLRDGRVASVELVPSEPPVGLKQRNSQALECADGEAAGRVEVEAPERLFVVP